jgi:hypothetical protein
MPCNCDYMDPDDKEVQYSKMYCVIDELNGLVRDKHEWDGYHPAVYGKVVSKARADLDIEALCQRLTKLEADGKISELSLEAQMWWRDHKQADEERHKREVEAARREALVQSARSKLTPEERQALGL